MPILARIWPGWSRHKTVVIPVPVSAWRPPHEPLCLEGTIFTPKRELHVTLIGRTLGRELRAAGLVRSPGLRDAFESQHWEYRRTGDGRWLRQTMDDGAQVQSLVELIEMPAMGALYRLLGAMLGRSLPTPPPHVTLYTAPRGLGIGVADRATLARYTHRRWTPGRVR